MKKQSVLPVFLAALALIVLLLGCRRAIYSYSFTQDLDNVISVEIRGYDYDSKETTPLLILDEETAQLLLADIAVIECYKQFGDYPRYSFSEIVVYITYENGEAEVIGNRNTATVDAAGRWWISSYYFDDASWNEVISKYIDANNTEDGSLS